MVFSLNPHPPRPRREVDDEGLLREIVVGLLGLIQGCPIGEVLEEHLERARSMGVPAPVLAQARLARRRGLLEGIINARWTESPVRSLVIRSRYGELERWMADFFSREFV